MFNNFMLKEQNLIKIIKLGVYTAMLAPLIYIPQTIFSAVFGKMIYFQAVIEIVLPFFLFLIIFYKGARPKMDLLTKFILLFFSTIFISSIFGVDWDRSFWGNPSRMRGIFSLLHFLAFYFYIRTCFAEKADRKKLLLFAIVIGIGVSVWGTIERINPDFSIDKVSIKGEAGHRIISTTGNPIFLAGYMTFVIFLSLYYFLKNKDYTRYVGIVGLVLSIVAIFFTGTRAAFLGIVMGIMAIVFYLFLFLKKKNKIILGVFLATFVSIFFLAIIMDADFLKSNRFTDLSLRIDDGSKSGRLLLWKESLSVFKQRPIFGWGLENFDIAFDKNYNPQFLRNGINETFADRAHNWYLDFLIMTGLIGFFAFVSIFIYTTIKLLQKQNRKLENSAFFGLFASFAVFIFFSVDAPSMTLMLFFSLALFSLIFSPKKEDSCISGKIFNFKFIVFLLFCSCVFMALWFFNIKPLQAGIDFIEWKRTKNIEQKEMLANKFLNDNILYIDNFRFHFANEVFLKDKDLNSPEYTEQSFDRAILELKKASLRHPQDFSFFHTIGNLYLKKGIEDSKYYEDAIENYKKALEISPKRQAVMFQMATAYIFKGEAYNAIDLLEQVVIFDDKAGQSHWRLGIAYLADNNKEKAYKSFQKALELKFYGKIEKERERVIRLCAELEEFEVGYRILFKKSYDTSYEYTPSVIKEIYYNTAMEYVMMGDIKRAKKFLESALNKYPEAKEEIERYKIEIEKY